jgi:transcriptional regulator with XRE-family HTH domain
MTGFKYIRNQYDKTLEELAEELGVSKQVVYMWENEKKSLPKSRAEQLSKMLRIPEKYFYIKEVSERDQLEIKNYRLGKELNDTSYYFEDEVQDSEGNRVIVPTNRFDSDIMQQFDFSTVALKMNDLFMKQKNIIEDYKPTFSEPSLSERENNFRDKEFLYRIRTIKTLDRFADIIKSNNHYEILYQIMRSMELFFDINVKKNQISGESASPMLFGLVSDEAKLVQKLVGVLKEYYAEAEEKKKEMLKDIQKSDENYKEGN